VFGHIRFDVHLPEANPPPFSFEPEAWQESGGCQLADFARAAAKECCGLVGTEHARRLPPRRFSDQGTGGDGRSVKRCLRLGNRLKISLSEPFYALLVVEWLKHGVNPYSRQ
jgi:hypothetical protein